MIDKINGRTPEEIKKGLKQCNSGSCDGCLYYDNCYSMCEMVCEKLNSDAFIYIHLLEDQVRDLTKMNQQLEREHDAAVVAIERKE